MLRPALAVFLLALPANAEAPGLHLSGDARMGLVWERPPAWAQQRENGLRMTSRARLKFQFIGETDGGVRYGAEFRLNPDTQRPNARRIFIGE